MRAPFTPRPEKIKANTSPSSCKPIVCIQNFSIENAAIGFHEPAVVSPFSSGV